MSDVTVPFGDDAGETATLLLAAAEKLHDDQTIVRTVSGAFTVPKDVADEAGVDYDDDEDDGSATEQDAKTTAKKAAPAKK